MTEIAIQDMGGTSLHTMEVNGFTHPPFFKSGDEIRNIFDNMPNLQFRDNDILLLTFQKTGTNWMYKMLSMVLNRSSERIESNKIMTMIEANGAEEMEAVASPRVMNSHYPYRYLPVNGLRDKQIKTILCLRNPKDVAVSLYNHTKGITYYQYTGKWSDWLPLYMQGKLEYGPYAEYLKGFEDAVKEGVGFPLHIMFYEDLKSNGLEELDKLLKFLNVDLDEDLKRSIVDMCTFAKMSTQEISPALQKYLKDGYNFFRKGEVGNWTEWFTVAQNEQFDEYWNTEMEGYDMFKFKYTI